MPCLVFQKVVIGNQEDWAIKGVIRALSRFFVPTNRIIVNTQAETISEGWTSTISNLIARAEKIMRYIENEKNSIGIVTQAGLVFMPGVPRPHLSVISAITLGFDRVALGYSLGVPIFVLGKNESLLFQFASLLAKKPSEKTLDDLVLELTKGYQSLTELVESSVKNAYISLKLTGNQPYISLKVLKENLIGEENVPV